MNRVTLSKEQWQSLAPEAATLENVIRVVETKVCRQGQVITRLTVNDMALTEIDEERLSATPANEVGTIEVEITGIRDLIFETIESSRLYAHSLKKMSLRLADQFRFEDTQETHKNMSALIDGLQSLLTAGELINQVFKTEGKSLNGWSDLNQGLVHQLTGMAEAYTRRDFVLLADQIEYDLSRILDDYSTTLSRQLDSSTERELP